MARKKNDKNITAEQAYFLPKLFFWVVVLALLLATIVMLQEILAPFIVGMIVAYILNPLVTTMSDRLAMPRWLSAILAIVFFFIIVGSLGVWVVPLLVQELLDLIGRLPDLLSHFDGLFNNYLTGLISGVSLQALDLGSVASAVKTGAGTVLKGVGGLAAGLFSRGMAILDFISYLVITPVVAFYCIRDWPLLTKGVLDLIPKQGKKTFEQLFDLFDQTLAGFVRGQSAVCLILGSFYALALIIVGLNFGLAIGFIAGVLSFIPYVGSIIGFGLSVGVAFFQFDGYTMAIVVAVIFAVGQFLEGNFLTPKLVGEQVGLHPVWIIFALMAGGHLLGFTGLLLAVPLTALIGVLIRYLIGVYKESRYYQ